MSLTNSTTIQHPPMHRPTTIPSKKAKRSNSSKKVLLHQPLPLLPSDDFVLFPFEVVTEKNSSVRHAPSGRSAKSANSSPSRLQALPLPDNHVIEHKAAAPVRTDVQRLRKPYRPSKCLYHMSARNCTAACIDARSPSPPPANIKVPPKAPSPPRLPTPDLSDVEEDDVWSCCRSRASNQSSEISLEDDDFWNEMSMLYHHLVIAATTADDDLVSDGQLENAIAWQKKGRNESRRSLVKAAR